MSNNRRLGRYSSYTPEFQRRINGRYFNMMNFSAQRNMWNNRRLSRYSPYIPEFQHRNNRSYFNMDNSAQRSWSSSNVSNINTNGEVNGVGRSGTALIRSSSTNAVYSWRHVNSYASNENMQNVLMNTHEGNQSSYSQHNVPTMFYNPFGDYSERASLATLPIYTNRIGTNPSNNATVQRKPGNSSNVSETNSDGVINRTDRAGTSSTRSTVIGAENGDIQTITENVYDGNYSNPQIAPVTSSNLVTTSISPATAYTTEPVNNSRNISESEMPTCAVCLEDYQGVLDKGSHFVVVSCGHAFCNICTLGFKASKKCPKCRSYITRRILRLHF